MSVDLSNLITPFQYEISPPGTNAYPLMGSPEALQRLMSAFWELKLIGVDFLQNYTCDDNGIITPIGGSIQGYAPYPSWYTDDGSGDLGQEIQQGIIIVASLTAVSGAYMNMKTMVSSKAGNVSYETQQSAQVLQVVYKVLIDKYNIILTRLSDLGSTSVAVLDAVIDNTSAIMNGNAWFVRGSLGGGGNGLAPNW